MWYIYIYSIFIYLLPWTTDYSWEGGQLKLFEPNSMGKTPKPLSAATSTALAGYDLLLLKVNDPSRKSFDCGLPSTYHQNTPEYADFPQIIPAAIKQTAH